MHRGQAPGKQRKDTYVLQGRHLPSSFPISTANKTSLHPEVIYMSGDRGDSMAEIAMQYNDSYNETVLSFANNIHTPEGGMHETGFRAALTRV